MKKLFVVIIIIAGVGVVLYYGFSGKDKLNQIKSEPSQPTAPSEDQLPPVEPDKIFSEPVTFSALKQVYSGQNFSFKYSDGFKVSSSIQPAPNGAQGELVAIENSKGSGFQIFTIPFDEKGPITPERIHRDLPDAEINDPKNADLDGSKTLVYNGYDEDMGETFEAWTVHGGKLYQIVGPKTAKDLIIGTLETWAWK